MKKYLLFFIILLNHFFINAMHQVKYEEDQHIIILTYNPRLRTMFATFEQPSSHKFEGTYDRDNTFAEKNLSTQHFSSNASSLYVPCYGRPFYIPTTTNPELVSKLKNAITVFEQHLSDPSYN